MKRRNLGFKITPKMTAGERYYEYARALEYEANKYRDRIDQMTERLKLKAGGTVWNVAFNDGPYKEWLRCAESSAKNFVCKVAAMIEAMEV